MTFTDTAKKDAAAAKGWIRRQAEARPFGFSVFSLAVGWCAHAYLWDPIKALFN